MLAASGGSPHVPNDLARALGLRNRHQLARLLARQNLPTLEILAAWIRVFGWLLAWERDRITLARAALEDGQDPAVRFRTVRDIVGCTWRELQERGSAWLMLELRNRYLSSSTDNEHLA